MLEDEEAWNKRIHYSERMPKLLYYVRDPGMCHTDRRQKSL